MPGIVAHLRFLAGEDAVVVDGVEKRRSLRKQLDRTNCRQQRRRLRHHRGRLLRGLIAEVRPTCEGAARQIERERRLLLSKTHFKEGIGLLGTHIGSRATNLGQTIADGVLHLQGDELGVAQLGVGAARPHGDARLLGDHRLPGKLAHAGVQGIGVARHHATHREINAPRESRPQARTQGVLRRAEKRRAAGQRTHLPHAESVQLIRQELLGARQARGEELINGLIHRALTAFLAIILKFLVTKSIFGFSEPSLFAMRRRLRPNLPVEGVETGKKYEFESLRKPRTRLCDHFYKSFCMQKKMPAAARPRASGLSGRSLSPRDSP